MNTNYKTKTVLLTILSLFLFHNIATAQVTIGNGKGSVNGAILQLKENENEDGANSTKGLGSPRVALIPSLTNDLGESLKHAIGSLDPQQHTAMLVYNVVENTTYCPGLHVWDGGLWIPLQSQGVQFFTDTRTKGDGTKEVIVYPYRTFGEAGTWMLTNLRATTYADNLNIDKPSKDVKIDKNAGASTTALCTYYPGVTTTSTLEEDRTRFSKNMEFGMLYTKAAATNEKPFLLQSDAESTYNSGEQNAPENIELVGVQGICPTGWHLPSDKEWNDLEKEIANEQTGEYTLNKYISAPWDDNWRYTMNNYRSTFGGHGTSMKSPLVPNYKGKSRVCGQGGFNGFATGNYSQSDINFYETIAFWWTSSYVFSPTYNRHMGVDRRFSYAHAGVGRYYSHVSALASVRCKKD